MSAYLDHAATTPMRAEAVAAMLPYLTEHFGNPSGAHAIARRAKRAIEEAREQVADALGCRPREVVFTSGGTEADNLAVAGVVARAGGRPLCTAVEHHAVLHAVEALGGTVVPVTPEGVVDLDALEKALTGDVSVVSVMLANNEVGVVQPLVEVAEVVRRSGTNAALHTDAVQAFPWLDVRPLVAGADLVAISGHKCGGPKGVGALAVRDGTRIAPLLHGGGQELERRSGTHNVAGIVGLAAAMTATVDQRPADVERVTALRNRFADGVLTAVPDAVETGDRTAKIAGNCHLRFPGVENEALLFLLDESGVCASAASACASGAASPSHVLSAMGIPRTDARTAIRFSLGHCTTEAEIDLALDVVPKAVERLRSA